MKANPELTEIFEQFRLDAIEWRATRSGHCWTARQKAYQSALDKMGVQWLEKTQAYFKSRLDDIESNIKKHNCFCGFSCDDDRYFQTHVIREHQEFEIPQDAPIDPKFLQLDNEFPIMDESSFTGSWRGVCEKCGKRERYYHPSKQKLFALCSVCGMDAINAFLAEIGVE